MSDSALLAAGNSSPSFNSSVNSSRPTIPGFFFYGDGCTHCDNVKPYLAELKSRYPDFNLKMLEVYHNSTNQQTFSAMTRDAGIANAGVPTLFIGTHALVGEVQIRNQLEPAILEQQQAGSSGVVTSSTTNVTVAGNCPGNANTLTIPLIIACALIDSINPCAFSVLIILLLSIVSLQNRRQVMIVGSTYIVAVFCFYLLSGIGLFSFVHVSGISSLIATAAAIIAIILGLINVIEVVRNKQDFTLSIPESRKPVIDRYIKTATLPAVFVLGVLVGIFELPCTGGIYLAILGLMSNSLTLSQGLPYLILYNFIFVLPLILILLIVVFGMPPERVNSWRMENRRMLRLIVGIAMILVGILILASPQFM